jgi:L,D-transpeptidase-like protein
MTPKKLYLPVALLSLTVVGPLVKITGASPADAEPVVKAAAAVPQPEIIPATPPEVMPAPAVRPAAPRMAFAHGVPGLSPQVLTMALQAVSSARARGISGREDLLTVIDYSLPSTEPRLWVLDLERGKVLYHELVAHGSGSGANYATQFSNQMNSRQTSLGLFVTAGTYQGGNGYSLILKGLDKGLNDLAEERHIVMHGAWYVSPQQARSQGRLGRSWGCPALSETVAPEVIDAIKGGTFLFSYADQAAGALPKYAG